MSGKEPSRQTLLKSMSPLKFFVLVICRYAEKDYKGHDWIVASKGSEFASRSSVLGIAFIADAIEDGEFDENEFDELWGKYTKDIGSDVPMGMIDKDCSGGSGTNLTLFLQTAKMKTKIKMHKVLSKIEMRPLMKTQIEAQIMVLVTTMKVVS